MTEKQETPKKDKKELSDINEKSEQLSEIVKLVKKWKAKRGALIMALHEVQGLMGYLPWEAISVVASELNVPVARIYEVVTFYNFFRLESPGKIIVSVCDGTACHIKGAAALIKEFSSILKISPAQTTEDQMFHLQAVRCLGCCGLAPVVVVNGKTYGKVQPSSAAGIVDEWRKKFA